MRDDFSQKVIRQLEKRVNSKCSNPAHRVPTSGPTAEVALSINIGVAAHICAAAPGGPRYDPKMSPEERSSITNGIWLCQNCASLIDRDPKTYTVELLKQWRADAETRAKEELGQIPISREHYEAMESLVFGTKQKQLRTDPISTMFQVAAESLERKDPRFRVEVERERGLTTYTYHARETVECSLSVKSDFAAEFSEKLSMLVTQGRGLKIGSNAVLLEGSPLFEQFRGGDGTFVIEPANRRAATVLIELLNDSGGSTFFAEIAGTIYPGTQSLRFDGKGLQDLFELELLLPRDSTRVHINSAFNFGIWENKDIAHLPGFDRAWSYYQSVRAGRTIRLRVEVEGTELAHLEGTMPSEQIVSLALIPYLRSARIIAAACSTPIRFDSNVRIPWGDYEALDDLRLRIELTDPCQLVSNATMTLSPLPGQSIERVKEYLSSTIGEIKTEQERDGFAIFDQLLPPFKLVTIFSNAKLAQVGKIGKRSIKAEIVPLDGCTIRSLVQKLH